MTFKNISLITSFGGILLFLMGCGGAISSNNSSLRLSLNTPLLAVTSLNAAAYPVSGLCNPQKGDVTVVVGIPEDNQQQSKAVNSQANNNGEVTQTFSCNPVEDDIASQSEITGQTQDPTTPSPVDQIVDNIVDTINQNTTSIEGEFSGTINLITVTQNPPQIKLVQGTATVTVLLSYLPINDQVGPASAPQVTLSSTRSGGFIGGFDNNNPITSHELTVVCNEPEEILSLEGLGIDPNPQTYTCSNLEAEDNSQMEAETFTITLASGVETTNTNTLTLSSKDKYENPAQATTSVEIPIDTLGPRVEIVSGTNIVQGQTASFTITVTEENLGSVNYTATTSGAETDTYTCTTDPCNITTGSINATGLLTLTILAESISDDLGNLGDEVDRTNDLTVLPAGTLAFNSLLTINTLNANSYTVSGQCDSRTGNVTVDISGVSEDISCDAIQGGPAGGGTFSGTMNVSSVTQNPPTITATQVTNTISGPSIINDQNGPTQAPAAVAPTAIVGGDGVISYDLLINCNEPNEEVSISGSGIILNQTYTCNTSGIETFKLYLVQNSEFLGSNPLTIFSVDEYGNQASSTTQVNVPIDTKAPVVSTTTGGDLIIGNQVTFTITVNDGSSFAPFTPQSSQGTITSGQCSSSPCQVTVSGTSVGSLNLVVPSGTVVDAAGNTNILSSTASLNVRASNLSIISPLPMATSLNASNYQVSGNCESTQGNVTVTIGIPNVSGSVSCSGGSYSATLDVASVTSNPMAVSVSQRAHIIQPSSLPQNDQDGPTQAPLATAPSGPINGSSYDLTITCNEAGETIQITGSGLSPAIQTYICSSSGAKIFNLTLASNIETTNPNNLTISSSDQHGNQADSTTQVSVPIDTKSPIVSITSSSNFLAGDNAVFTITILDGNSFLPFVPNSSSGTITSGQCLSSPCTVIVGGASVGNLSLTVNTGSVVDIAGNSNTTNAVKNANIIVSNLSIDSLLYVGASNASNYSVSGNCESTQGNVTIIAGIPNVSESVSCSGGSYSATLNVSSVTANPMAVSVSQSTNNITSSIENDTCFSFTFNGSEVTVTSYLSTNIEGESCSTNIVIPERVTSIADEAFKDKALTSVEFPEDLMTIGASAFQGNNLTSILIPEGVVSIGDNAFSGNSNLEFIIFSNPSPVVGTDAFPNGYVVETKDECFEFDATDYNQINDYYDNEDSNSNNPACSRDVMIPQGVTAIGDNAFHINALTLVIIPDSVTSIGSYAFSSNALTSVTIPDSVTSVGAYAFHSNDLISVTIPDSVTSIGDHAFSYNDLTSVTIPDSVISIGTYAFGDNDLTSVTIPDSVTSIGDHAFINNDLTSVTIPDSVTSIGDWAFFNNDLTSVTIPDSVTSIGDSVFRNNDLTSVTIPDSVTSIGGYAFYYNALTSVTIPDSVTTIGDNAFGSNDLTSVTIPDSVISIETYAFGANDLASVIIGSGITSIGPKAFADNNDLTSVCIEANQDDVTESDEAFHITPTYDADGDCFNN